MGEKLPRRRAPRQGDGAGPGPSGDCGPPPQGSGLATGDRVFCRISASRAGSAREYALAKAVELAEVPSKLDCVGAAATPLSALTARQALSNIASWTRADRRRNSTQRMLDAKILG
jgi:NADPH:quinone reductase-like Zn-dependent oxidoreductase